MKRFLLVASVVGAVGLLGAGIALAVTSGGAASSNSVPQPGQGTVTAQDIPMLTLIDRLQLTHDQTQKMHDILAGLVTRVAAVQTESQALANDLLAFHGTQDELDQKLADFKAGIGTPLRDAVTQLGDVLTYNQGKLLQRAVLGRLTAVSTLSQMSGQTGSTSTTASGGETSNGAQALGRRLLSGKLAQRGVQLGQAAVADSSQMAQGQTFLRVARRIEAGTPRLERFVHLLELKLAQSPA